MAKDTDFEKADKEAGVEVLPAKQDNTPVPMTAGGVPVNVVHFRDQLVRQYHEGAPSLIKRLREAGKEDIESLLVALIDEVVTETDHLLGNELVATQNGDLRDSSIISFKRTEALEKAIKAVQAKQEFERTGGIDVDSPAMVTVFKFFMSKTKEAMDRMGVGAEMNDLFFSTLSDVTGDWKKELRAEFEALKS
ncbi:unnamed protein product [marine sediment metagenome]|uniref:Uncharacterized protein n=1 Tax=marine sediment metagenome TaxID=412755 RepID=X1BGX4_9ZZZZ